MVLRAVDDEMIEPLKNEMMDARACPQISLSRMIQTSKNSGGIFLFRDTCSEVLHNKRIFPTTVRSYLLYSLPSPWRRLQSMLHILLTRHSGYCVVCSKLVTSTSCSIQSARLWWKESILSLTQLRNRPLLAGHRV